jgi:hypothetical protein
VTYSRFCINTIEFPDDEHKVARNMERIAIYIYIYMCVCVYICVCVCIYIYIYIYIYKEVVRQVGYLLELYREEQSPEYKIL